MIGSYELAADALTITLPMPSIDGEGEWTMLGQFALPAHLGAQPELIGMMRGILPNDESVDHSCALKRRMTEA